MNIIYIVLGVVIVALLIVCLVLLLRQDKQRGSEELAAAIRAELERMEQSRREDSRADRAELSRSLQEVNRTLVAQIGEMGRGQSQQLAEMTQNNNEELARLRKTIDGKLQEIQKDNEQRLEQMRRTVDEKLSDTLNKRLGESFNLVNDRLEQVHKGLGEMQGLTSNMADIKKIFNNVKTRGVWGEVQLGHILEEILTPDQYEANFAASARSKDRVEFAVRLPRRDGDGGGVYLPIDSKFPVEDYQRVVLAEEAGDPEGVVQARKALEAALKTQAAKIAEKYIRPPHTLEYAIMFLPTESLYAESLRLRGFCEFAYSHQIMVAGPTNLAALLNSIKLGFSTLAVQEKSGEIRKLLGAVKANMNTFANNLEAAQKKIGEAGRAIDTARQRTDTINRRLTKVEQLELHESDRLLDDPPEE